jgi:hypothetical protein
LEVRRHQLGHQRERSDQERLQLALPQIAIDLVELSEDQIGQRERDVGQREDQGNLDQG